MKKLAIMSIGFVAGSVLGLAPALAAESWAGGNSQRTTARTASVQIIHVTRGCHDWLYHGKKFVRLTLTLSPGSNLSITDNDVMPHKLIKTSGPAVRYVGNPSLRRVSASVKVLFSRTGVYSFTTKAGEDYIKGVETIGEDHQLRLVVRVVS